MRKLILNHAALRRRSLLAQVLLATGGVAAILVIAAISQVSARTEALESDADRLRHPLQRPAITEDERKHEQAEIASAQSAMVELSLPWEPLFQAVEGMRMPKVRLLAMEPDPRQRKVRITAEAPSSAQMLAYVQALSRQPMLKDVFLLRQERNDDGRQVFSVEAIWEMQHDG